MIPEKPVKSRHVFGTHSPKIGTGGILLIIFTSRSCSNMEQFLKVKFDPN